jgi:hypothetical protein
MPPTKKKSRAYGIEVKIKGVSVTVETDFGG